MEEEMIQQLKPEKLKTRTAEVRTHLNEVRQILQEGLLEEVRTEILQNTPNLVPINGQYEPVQRLFTLFAGVAEVIQAAAEHSFDTVVYPASGSDLIGGLAFDTEKLITIDEDDLFARVDKDKPQDWGGKVSYFWRILQGDKMPVAGNDTKEVLHEALLNKLVAGMHVHYRSNGLTAYAMELALLGVDPLSYQILEEQTVGDLRKTTAKFNLPDGRIIEHINIGGYNIREQFSPDRLEDKIVMQTIRDHTNAGQIMLLSKAGGDSQNPRLTTTTPFYSLLPNGTVVVSDQSELNHLPAVTPVNLIDLRTPETIAQLDKLQAGYRVPSAVKLEQYPKHLYFGYALDLRELEIWRIQKRKSTLESLAQVA